MALSINWATKVITVPQADLTLVSGVIYEHDVDAFQRDLSDILDSEEGAPQLPTHNHNTELVLAGVTYVRSVEIINGYTVTYENGNYRVNLVGANNNIIDVLNYNSVQVVPNNSAGLVSNATPEQIAGALLKADFATVTGEADKSLINALRKMRNKVVVNPTTKKLIVYKEDDVTVAYEQDVTFDESLKPIKSID